MFHYLKINYNNITSLLKLWDPLYCLEDYNPRNKGKRHKLILLYALEFCEFWFRVLSFSERYSGSHNWSRKIILIILFRHLNKLENAVYTVHVRLQHTEKFKVKMMLSFVCFSFFVFFVVVVFLCLSKVTRISEFWFRGLYSSKRYNGSQNWSRTITWLL